MKYMQLMDFYDHYQELFFDFEMEINQYIRFRKATGFTDEEKRCFGILPQRPERTNIWFLTGTRLFRDRMRKTLLLYA